MTEEQPSADERFTDWPDELFCGDISARYEGSSLRHIVISAAYEDGTLIPITVREARGLRDWLNKVLP